MAGGFELYGSFENMTMRLSAYIVIHQATSCQSSLMENLRGIRKTGRKELMPAYRDNFNETGSLELTMARAMVEPEIFASIVERFFVTPN